jgi:hypothetical protein
MKPKEPRISVRVDQVLKARIEAVVEKTGIDETVLVRNCIEALCASVEKTGELTFPIKITTCKTKEHPSSLAGAVGPPAIIRPAALNEPAPRYRIPRKK